METFGWIVFGFVIGFALGGATGPALWAKIKKVHGR